MAIIARASSRVSTGVGHIGKLGKLMNLPDVRVTFKKRYDNERGGYWLYKFVTAFGDDLTAFYSGNKFEADKGDVVHIRFKVKEHGDWEGSPVTYISHIQQIDEQYARTGKKGGPKRHSPTRQGPLTKDERWGEDIPIDPDLGF